MKNVWLVLPIVIPFMTGSLTLLSYRSRRLQRGLNLAGAIGLLASGLILLWLVWEYGIQVEQISDWRAPFGITLVADLFSATLVTLAGVNGVAVALFSLASIDPQRESFSYYPLYHFMLMGVCGALLTGDIFNLYVWFELMLIASFVLLALGGEPDQMEGAIKYVALNLVSSSLFLSGVGLIYGLAGTLNMADLAAKLAQLDSFTSPGILISLAMLLLVAFGIKAAIFPLYFWLPASYHTPPVAVTAIFAGLLTKVGVYAIVRMFTLIFQPAMIFAQPLILVIAGLTMVTGVLGAVAQFEFRRLLSFHIISQIGYLLMGLGIFNPLALGSVTIFIFHVSVTKVALFLVSGVTARLRGTYDLKELGGLYQTQPLLSILFLITALSLAGFPPLSGFLAKLSLIYAGLDSNNYTITTVALAVSLLTLYSMVKIWNEAFWKPNPKEPDALYGEDERVPNTFTLLAPIVFLAGIALFIGLGGGSVFTFALRTGEQLMDPTRYILAVMNNR